jgi:hypothetical protein
LEYARPNEELRSHPSVRTERLSHQPRAVGTRLWHELLHTVTHDERAASYGTRTIHIRDGRLAEAEEPARTESCA